MYHLDSFTPKSYVSTARVNLFGFSGIDCTLDVQKLHQELLNLAYFLSNYKMASLTSSPSRSSLLREYCAGIVRMPFHVSVNQISRSSGKIKCSVAGGFISLFFPINR